MAKSTVPHSEAKKRVNTFIACLRRNVLCSCCGIQYWDENEAAMEMEWEIGICFWVSTTNLSAT